MVFCKKGLSDRADPPEADPSERPRPGGQVSECVRILFHNHYCAALKLVPLSFKRPRADLRFRAVPRVTGARAGEGVKQLPQEQRPTQDVTGSRNLHIQNYLYLRNSLTRKFLLTNNKFTCQ